MLLDEEKRAVGVRYDKETESRSHYYDASLIMQVDAWIHVDESSALTPPMGHHSRS